MALRSVAPPSHVLVDYHLEWVGMRLHDAFGINCKCGPKLKVPGIFQVPGRFTKGCVCVMIVERNLT